jgi:transcriptional regulator with XRE-family HTH domain
MLLGSTVRKFRLASGLSQRELAQEARISASFLSLIERDRREPTVGVLRRLAQALRVPFGVLLAAALGIPDSAPASSPISTALRDLLESVRLQLLTMSAESNQHKLFEAN